jgi:hypothetical protein
MDYLFDIVNSEMFQTIQLVVVIAGGLLCIVGMFLKMFPEFVKKHIVGEFNGPDVCFDCNKITCNECPFKEKHNG